MLCCVVLCCVCCVKRENGYVFAAPWPSVVSVCVCVQWVVVCMGMREEHGCKWRGVRTRVVLRQMIFPGLSTVCGAPADWRTGGPPWKTVLEGSKKTIALTSS